MKYIFRGVVVFEYDPATKQMSCGQSDYNGNHFNYCRFVPEDYELLSKFFTTAHQHATGVLHESFLKDVEVN